MANLPEIVQYDAGIYQIETTDPVLGGENGVANLQPKQLANRTAFLKKQIDDILSGLNVPVGLATIAYIQAQLDKLDHKQSVRVATTANISLSGVQTIDSVAVVSGDRVLAKNQTDPTLNGIWTVNGSTWSRASDANESGEVTSGLVIYVEEGALQGKSRWQLTTPAPIVIGTTGLVFGDITAGMAPLKSPAFTDTPTAPKLSRFATGGALVSADTLKERGNQFNAVRSIALTASTVNLTAADAGSLVVITGSGGGTLVLPAANAVPAGGEIAVRCSNTSVSTNILKGAGTDTIGGAAGAGANSTTLKQNDALILVSDGVSKWDIATEATAAFIVQQFTSGLLTGVIGYQKLPGGLVIQWGSTQAVPSGSSVTVTLPTTHPNATLQVCCTAQSSSNLTTSIGSAWQNNNVSSFILRNHSVNAAIFSWLSIGY